MKIMKLISSTRYILSRYLTSLRVFTGAAAYIALITLISLLISVPLWFTATRYSRTYTAVVLAAVFIILIVLFTRKTTLWIRSKKAAGMGSLQIILIPVTRTAVVLCMLVFLYVIVLLFTSGFAALALPLSVLYLVLLGYLIFIKSGGNENKVS